jgi:hypothetical protein
MRITVPHYFDFGADREFVGADLVRPEAWDAIRTQSTGDFSMPASRGEWEAQAEAHPILGERARGIDELLAERGLASSDLASYGVGGAAMECWLQRARPQRKLVLGEYAPATVDRLRQIVTEAEVHLHDLRADPPLEAEFHLFHRIDTEFDNREWKRILDRFRERSILLVANIVIDWKRAVVELKEGVLNRNATRSGLFRNRAAFEALWRDTHDADPVEVADLHAWILTPMR